MKSNPISLVGAILLLLFCNHTKAQSFGPIASAVWITDCNQNNFFNTSGNPADLIGPAVNVFDNVNLGVHTQNSGTLILRGAQLKTFKNPSPANVCSVRMFYRHYNEIGVPGAFISVDLPFLEDCNTPSGQFPSGGPCQDGDQKWQRINSFINLTNHTPGNYVVEVYYEVSGSSSTTTLCNELVTLNNGGNNYKAFFTVQAPTISSTNPSSCNGTEGSITISGLAANATYLLSYTDIATPVPAASYTANGTGQITITGLDAGLYSNFALQINGCTTNLFTGVILSNPIFVSTFTPITPFCAGTAAPVLPTTSNNGITGTWNPAVINNQASGNYTFTPDGNQCGLGITLSVTVLPSTTPTFSFGTSLVICDDGTVPVLPTMSSNGIAGTWSPAVVDNQNSGTYTFTPNPGPCATSATFNVTVNPNLPPSFSFGSALTICAGNTVPALPATSDNGITGTWSPSAVDNQNSAVYTFTPGPGQCATTATFTVTENPNVTPVFSFGTSLTVCAGGTVPALPTNSTNGITGTWSPAVVDNQNSGTYTFTPTPGLCATNTTFTVTISPNITPTFSFGTSLSICAGGSVPSFPPISINGITGSWNPAVIDNQNTGTYTFTPTAGLCAVPTTLTVTVNPNITPTFSFGTSASICAGSAAPVLPTTSGNGITGTWSPSTVNNQNSGTYTFTPSPGLCATTTTFTVTVNPNITPTFSFGTSLTICAGATVPVLPTTSTNGITGTWNPAVVSNQNSATYTFTPTAGLCATTATFTVTITPNVIPTFSFGNNLTVCANAAVPVLPTTSTNGITGTWNPAVVSNQNSAMYTFTPTAGICATNTTFSVIIIQNVLPTFSFGTTLSVCTGGTVPTLPTTSTNNINGTWSPAVVSTQNSGTYTFTPNPGVCAVPTTFTVTVNPNVTPVFSFGTSLTICAGGTVPTLPATSTNGITGTWNPAVVDNQNSGVYTFTPTAGLCAIAATFTVTVNPNITPTFSFGTSLSICAGASVPSFPPVSINGITGSWSPGVIDNQNSGVYTFTPTAGLCAVPTTLTVTVNPNITPLFSFGTSVTICAGATAPVLPATSTNNITGTWSPATVDNQNSGTYTFTPAPGLCATTTTLTVTISPNITPLFSFGTTLTICAGGTVPVLPTTSTNGITGVWSPAVADNQASAVYTFTPTAGLCATTTTFTITVNPNIPPTFSFGTSLTICAGASVPSFPPISINGITGTWSPGLIDNQNSGIYTFTPTAGLCAVPATLTVTVNPNITPVFSFGPDLTICAGGTVPVLPSTSSNGITGTWSPAVVDNQNSGVYTFTPTAGQCVIPSTVTFTVTVTPNIIPTFSFGPNLTICTGGVVPILPTTSNNGLSGTWSPAVVSDQATGTYVFTPALGQCVTPLTFNVTVNPILTPAFAFGVSQSICIGGTVPVLPATSTNGITGTWSPAIVSNAVSGVYTFTPSAGQCATTASFTLEANAIPTTSIRTDTTVYDGAVVPGFNFIGSTGAVISWTNSNTAVGLAASGTGAVPSFVAINTGNTTVTATITVTPVINGCTGLVQTYTITVLPLNKDVFVPNVFSPNGDGKNDLLFVYGNYIDKVDLRIFNQWGQQIATINNKVQGWDGKHKGNPQPVGVYVYVLKAVLADGRTVNLKGSITLVR